MIAGIDMINNGGTLATIRYTKNTGEADYSLSVTVLMPSLFGECKTRTDLETKVGAWGEANKTFFMDRYYKEMLEVDERYQCMKAFDGLGGDYECFVDRVSSLSQSALPLASTFEIIDHWFENGLDD